MTSALAIIFAIPAAIAINLFFPWLIERYGWWVVVAPMTAMFLYDFFVG